MITLQGGTVYKIEGNAVNGDLSLEAKIPYLPYGHVYNTVLIRSDLTTSTQTGYYMGSKYAGMLGTLSEYTKPSSYSAISSDDTINEAIGKLEAGLGTGGTSTEVLDLSDIGLSSENNVTETITVSQDILDRVMEAYQKNINTVKIDNSIASCNITSAGSTTLINIAPRYLLYGEALLIVFKTLMFNGT
jgi:hypothetical protein